MRTALILTCLLVPLVPGCGTTPEQRMNLAESWLSTGEGWSRDLDDGAAAAQLIADDIVLRLQDPNLPATEAEKMRVVLQEAKAQIETFRTHKALIDADLVKLRARLAQVREQGATIANEMEFYSQGLQLLGQRVGGQVGGYISLAAMLIGAVGGALGGGYVQGQRVRGVLANVVASVSALLASPTVSNRDTATATLEAGQLPATRTEVRKLLGKES